MKKELSGNNFGNLRLWFREGTVRVGYSVLLIVVAMKCGEGVARASRGANDDVTIE